jgi:hypothetical protein
MQIMTGRLSRSESSLLPLPTGDGWSLESLPRRNGLTLLENQAFKDAVLLLMACCNDVGTRSTVGGGPHQGRGERP